MSIDYTKRTWGEEKLAVLNDFDKQLDKLKTAVAMMKDGYAEAYVCREVGLNQPAFRHLIAHPNLGYVSSIEGMDISDPVVQKKVASYLLSWQERLYMDVFGIKNISDIPLDVNSSVETALTMLPKREADVLLYRYRDGITLDETGYKIGVTRERARQIEHKALRLLRHSNISSVLKYGENFKKQLDSLRNDVSQGLVSESMEKLSKEYEAAVKKNDDNKLWEIAADIVKRKPELLSHLAEVNKVGMFPKKVSLDELNGIRTLQTPIEDANFSVRTYNCLHRAHLFAKYDRSGVTKELRTLGDVAELSIKQISRIRNLGTKSLKEIVDTFDSIGVPLKEREGYTPVFKEQDSPEPVPEEIDDDYDEDR